MAELFSVGGKLLFLYVLGAGLCASVACKYGHHIWRGNLDRKKTGSEKIVSDAFNRA